MLFSDFYHRLSKDQHAGRPPRASDSAQWPEEWRTIFYKTYPDLPHIALDTEAMRTSSSLFEHIATRRSARSFAQNPIPLRDISTLLRYSCGIQDTDGGTTDEHDGLTPEQHRAQPSGGARFPVEAYLFNFVTGEIPSGVFHYDVRHHQLDVLLTRAFSKEDIGTLFYYPFIKEASCAIVLTAVFDRTQAKYGERGYRYILFEAGHIGQNISLVSSALGLKSLMMGGSNDVEIERLLSIGTTESFIYSAILGT